MQLKLDGERPIYLELATGIEDSILSGAFPEETQIPSTTEISINYKINPATALKGINLLVDEGIIYKKRGLGMFVCSGAADKILDKRKKEFKKQFIETLICEAEKLKITKEELIKMIERGMDR